MTSVGTSLAATVRFGRFELRPAERQLLMDHRPAAMGSRAFDVLLALVEHRSRVVSKSELIELAWPGLVVEENNLSVQISALRKLLGPSAIATVSGRGYRFTAPLSPTREPDRGSRTTDFDEPPSALALRTHLPEVLAPLFGREKDLASLRVQVAENRLVTITGAGGVGKTRVAEHMLHDLRDSFEHGVVWIDLAGLAAGSLLNSTIVGALGLQVGTADSIDGIVAALRPLRMMIALDNAEHVADEAADFVTAVLVGAAEVRLLVTSQVALKLPIEHVFHLNPLAFPTQPVSAHDALAFGAVSLFVARAQAADRHFELTARDVDGVVSICRQLDGLPLAIELAASRTAVFGVAKLGELLHQRLRLLTKGLRGAPERQRTLRAAFEWSYELLNDKEAVLFRRLAVFSGGFSLELAHAVVMDPRDTQGSPSLRDDWELVDALDALIGRSMVAIESAYAGRYRLFESARSFALERLAEAGEDAAFRRQHSRAVTEHFRLIERQCRRGELGVDAAVLQLEPDLDNARAAMRWALETKDALCAVTLAPPMSFALTAAGYQERIQLWDATAAHLDDTIPKDVEAAWANAHSGFGYRRRPEAARASARRAIVLARELGEPVGLYIALGKLATLSAVNAQSLAEGVQACEELRRLEDPAWPAQVRVFGNHGIFAVELRRGHFEAALEALDRTKSLAKAAGDTPRLLNNLTAIADLELALGRIDDAVAHGLELEASVSGTRHQGALAYARVNVTGALLARGSLAQARAMARAAWPLALQFDLIHALADNLAQLAALEGRMRSAAQLVGFADSVYAKFGADREPNEASAIGRAERLAREQIGDDALRGLKAQGSSLRPEVAFEIAFEVEDGAPATST